MSYAILELAVTSHAMASSREQLSCGIIIDELIGSETAELLTAYSLQHHSDSSAERMSHQSLKTSHSTK